MKRKLQLDFVDRVLLVPAIVISITGIIESSNPAIILGAVLSAIYIIRPVIESLCTKN